MKEAAKIFIIISMVLGIFAIFPTVLGYVALQKMKQGQMTTGWKVIVLLFVSLIGGVLLLCDNSDTSQDTFL